MAANSITWTSVQVTFKLLGKSLSFVDGRIEFTNCSELKDFYSCSLIGATNLSSVLKFVGLTFAFLRFRR
jgi:hypothetical protein